jgi:hypothetical protein
MVERGKIVYRAELWFKRGSRAERLKSLEYRTLRGLQGWITRQTQDRARPYRAVVEHYRCVHVDVMEDRRAPRPTR